MTLGSVSPRDSRARVAGVKVGVKFSFDRYRGAGARSLKAKVKAVQTVA